MTRHFRPVHSSFESLRLAAEPVRPGQGYHRFGSATNEQLSARVFARPSVISRPSAVFADFSEF
jgi:hypothetical protein